MGSLKAAQKLFDEIPERNAVLWGTMMRVYLKFSEPIKVFELLFEMRTFGLELDAFTSECAIRACGNISADREGKSVHGFCTRQNFIDSNIYLQTSLIEMYLKCGLLDFGLRLFEGAKIKDVVLWTATIAGFAKNGRAWEAAALFRQMLEQSISPNPITLSSVLLACTHIGSLQRGKSLHGYMIRKEVEMDVVSYTSLIDMYAKCGLISEAYTVFRKMPTKNTFTWSAMISGFGINGLFDEAIEVFNQMRSENQIPNSITFVSVLSACSHSGRVEEGWNYLKLMSMDYGITAVEEHIACMVDLLGRAGKIDEALSFIRDMPMKPGASAWGALLSACRLHRRVEIVEEAAKKLLPLEPDKTAVYVLLSNVYGDAGMWENVNKIRLKVGENGFYKTAGFSSIEVDKKIRFFFSETRLARGYTQVEGVCISLQEIMKRLISYVPDNGSVHYDVGG
ncbi:unnamed protein product [Thlaspi arvense]|uniref:Pentatricopeptide repeat-containing protein n=1 Tax=Thlaspi arvense TaxID=13288 RepID=A0AAU9T6K7_THLAR|nr:unnamed protein product [Thlaspi arvense]